MQKSETPHWTFSVSIISDRLATPMIGRFHASSCINIGPVVETRYADIALPLDFVHIFHPPTNFSVKN